MNTCEECGAANGHHRTCSHYKPDPEYTLDEIILPGREQDLLILIRSCATVGYFDSRTIQDYDAALREILILTAHLGNIDRVTLKTDLRDFGTNLPRKTF